MADFILREADIAKLRTDITSEMTQVLRGLLAESQEPRLVDGDRMAELAGLSRPTIDRLVKEEKIPSCKVGRRRLYQPTEVIKALTKKGVCRC